MVTFLVLKLFFMEINNKKSVIDFIYNAHILIIEKYL